uniref:Kinase n=1 Tax=Ascaris lumbricoides TaxID=6252 RepID=A0A9J2PW41_ASCLU
MKAGQTTLPEKYEWFSEQIAGHHPSVVRNGEHQIGFIKEKGSALLLKPVQDGVRGQCEVALYNSVRNWIVEAAPKGQKNQLERDKHVMIKFAEFVPKYFGLKTIFIGPKEVQCLVMEDLTYQYRQPCTMDIKMGKVTYDPNASDAKRISETVKYPAQETLGFRLLGYRMHCTEGDPPRVRDKLWGRSKTLENIVDAYGEFFSGRSGEENRVAEEVLSQLIAIREWFKEQRIYHFYASSILIVYEASLERPARVRVRLIDFSHVFPAEQRPDENYLFGLNNMITFVEQFRDSLPCPN